MEEYRDQWGDKTYPPEWEEASDIVGAALYNANGTGSGTADALLALYEAGYTISKAGR